MKHLKDQSTALTCFQAYDVRGELGVNFNVKIAHRIGRAKGQHFQATIIVLGFDARETPQELETATIREICEAGSHVLSIGLVETHGAIILMHAKPLGFAAGQPERGLPCP